MREIYLNRDGDFKIRWEGLKKSSVLFVAFGNTYRNIYELIHECCEGIEHVDNFNDFMLEKLNKTWQDYKIYDEDVEQYVIDDESMEKDFSKITLTEEDYKKLIERALECCEFSYAKNGVWCASLDDDEDED